MKNKSGAEEKIPEKKDKIVTYGCIIIYQRKPPTARMREESKEARKFRHQNKSEKTGYTIVRVDKVQRFLEKYREKVTNMRALVKWNNMGN